DRRDMKLKRIFLDGEPMPNPVHQVVFVDDVAAGLYQNLNDFKGTAADGNRIATPSELPPGKIDFPILVGIDRMKVLLRHVDPYSRPRSQDFSALRQRNDALTKCSLLHGNCAKPYAATA